MLRYGKIIIICKNKMVDYGRSSYTIYSLFDQIEIQSIKFNFFLIYSQSKDPQICLSKHRVRQTTFMSRCMRELKDRNKTWVLLIDVDEYISSDALDWAVMIHTMGCNCHPTLFLILISTKQYTIY